MPAAWVFDDGGRAAAGFRGSTGDCVTRAVAIGTGRPYRAVYDDLHVLLRDRKPRKRDRSPSRSPRDGVPTDVVRAYLEMQGWSWRPVMGIGTGTTVHLLADELPPGRLIAKCSRHVVAVVDGVVHDTHDCTRGGTRAVYGYWSPPSA